MFTKILVPVDGSENSWHALHHAMTIGEKFNSSILVLNVIQPYNNAALLAVPLDYATISQGNNELAKVGDKVLAMAAERLENYAGKVEYQLKMGHPSEQILDVATKTDCDIIILGSRGLSSIAEFFLGSVSSKVAQYAQIPVLIVK